MTAPTPDKTIEQESPEDILLYAECLLGEFFTIDPATPDFTGIVGQVIRQHLDVCAERDELLRRHQNALNALMPKQYPKAIENGVK